MKRILIVVGMVVGLTVVALVLRSKSVVAPTPAEMPVKRLSSDNDKTDPAVSNSKALILGKSDAKLTIVEYGDFQCPICQRFFSQTEPQLMKDYIDTGKVKIEFRVETHLGMASVLAGEAAYCSNDQLKFKAFHDSLYSNQGKVDFSEVNLKKMAKELGLNSVSFDKCLDDGAYKSAVEHSDREAKTKITGTPTFFIGQQKIVGAQPYGVFKAVIESELKVIK